MNPAKTTEKRLQASTMLYFTDFGFQNKIHLEDTVYTKVSHFYYFFSPKQLTHQDAFHLPMERFHFKDSVRHLLIFFCSGNRVFSQEGDQAFVF